VDIGTCLRKVGRPNASLVGIREVGQHRLGVENVTIRHDLTHIDPSDLAEQMEEVGNIHHRCFVAVGRVHQRAGNYQWDPYSCLVNVAFGASTFLRVLGAK
jgi:hypothetical protein